MYIFDDFDDQLRTACMKMPQHSGTSHILIYKVLLLGGGIRSKHVGYPATPKICGHMIFVPIPPLLLPCASNDFIKEIPRDDYVDCQ